MHTELIIRFGYGCSVPWVTKLAEGGIARSREPDMLVLRTTVPFKAWTGRRSAAFDVSAGERIPLS